MFSGALFLICLLISPAFCFLVGMRLASRYDIDLEASSTTSQIITLIVLTTVILLLTAPLIIWSLPLFDIRFEALVHGLFSHGPDTANFFLDLDGSFNWLHGSAFFIYIIFLYSISGGCGALFIKGVEAGIIPTSFFHGPLYEPLVKGKNDPFSYCTVVTKLTNDAHTLMYFGRIEALTYKNRMDIKYIVLSNAQKFTLKIGDIVETAKDKCEVSYTKDPQHKELLYINGEEISNVLFSGYPVEDISESDAKEILNKKT